jgi:hypothetical protein
MKTNRKPTSAISRPAKKRRSNWQYYTVAVTCCAVLVAGFFFAARKHFSSMEYGLQNSRLRHQLDELQSEKRRLLLSREFTMTPGELKKAVRRVGSTDYLNSLKDSAKAEISSAGKSVVKTVEGSMPMNTGSSNKVVPTVITSPVKTERSEKQARRDSTPSKKDRT